MVYGSADYVRQRMDTCKACPAWMPGFFKGMERCSECGCIIRGKVQIKSAVCPLDKWPKPTEVMK